MSKLLSAIPYYWTIERSIIIDGPANIRSSAVIKKIISGDQTGADRAALDSALEPDIPHGGWCPKGRLVQDDLPRCPLPTHRLKAQNITNLIERFFLPSKWKGKYDTCPK